MIALVLVMGCASVRTHGSKPVTPPHPESQMKPKPPVTPEAFITAYEAALASQDWAVVEPLVHRDACVTFTNGSVHEGRAAVQAAFTRNFSLIKSEQYTISNVRWVRTSDDFAAYLFEFSWQGVINGEPASGAGQGTCIIVREHDHWQLLIEHLGPRSP